MIIRNNTGYQILKEYQDKDIFGNKEYVVRTGKSILYMMSETLFYNISELQNLIIEINEGKWTNVERKKQRLTYLNDIKQSMREYIIEDLVREEDNDDWILNAC
jgi:hypothetical protein